MDRSTYWKQAQEPDWKAMTLAQARWNAIAKPLNSLGQLEKMIVRMAGIQGSDRVCASPRCVLVFCADNGVICEGVSQSGSEVTALVAHSIAEGTSNINLMAQAVGADVFAVDMGMMRRVEHPSLIDRHVMDGTDNIAEGPAMTRAQAEQAVQAGFELVGEKKRAGYRVIATGEMGIGNSTTSSAVIAALAGLEPALVTGRGAGLSDEGLARKTEVIRRALNVNRPDPRDALDVLAKVGGLDLAGMMGAYLGGAYYRVPVVIDGLISSAAALLAARYYPVAREYMLASHVSREPAGQMTLDELGLTAIVHGDMALGEGTGAVTLFPLLDMALNVYHGPHTFEGLGMAAYKPQGGKA